MKLYENAMKNVLMELLDDVASKLHFVDAKESEREEIKGSLLDALKDKLKTKYNEELDDDYIAAYLGDYIDTVVTNVIENKLQECDSFSTSVSGALGLTNGIPQSGDGKGVVATKLFGNKPKKRKRRFRVIVK